MVQKNYMTTKQEDMIAEQQLAKYLDKYLYDRLKSKCKSINRITDKTLQMEGIDVIIEYNNGNLVNIDEKAQLHYIDVCRNTFVFEIDFIGRDNILHQGWLYNNELKTDTYMLIWPKETIYNEVIKSIDNNKEQLNKIKEILRNINRDDFVSVECYLIKRDTIKEYLSSKGWNFQRILKKADEIRHNKKYKRTFVPETDDFYFYFSEPFNYRESPINIVIKKDVLKELAHKKYNVTKDYLQLIP